MAGSGLVQEGEARHLREQGGGDLRHEAVQRARALAAAKDEQMRRGSGGARGEMEEVGADGDAGEAGSVKIVGGGLEVNGGGADPGADQAVGESGHGVGLKGQGGDAQQDGRAHHGTRGVSADADDDGGAELVEQAHALPEAEGQIDEGAQARGERDVVELADADQIAEDNRPGGRGAIRDRGRCRRRGSGRRSGP